MRSPLARITAVGGTAIFTAAVLGATWHSAESSKHPDATAPHSLDAGTGNASRAIPPVTIHAALGEVFTPITAVSPPVAADVAWQRYASARGSGQSVAPPSVTAQLGRLTFPVGAGRPNDFHANGELVWGFSWRECPPVVGNVAPSVSGTCIAWAFVDATDKHEVDATWQD